MNKLSNKGISKIGPVLSIVAIFVIVGGVWFVSSNNSESENENVNQNSSNQIQANQGLEDRVVNTDNNGASQSGQYIDYSQTSFASVQGQKRVLFFHAGWCPTCRVADSRFNSNLDKIPSGVVLLKTDYDSESALKSKYGVTYQHTFVQVDENGNALVKWNGGDIDKLIDNVI